MNRFTRIYNVLAGVFMILISIVMFAVPNLGYALATLIFGITLMVSGIRQMIYFFSMGIHMVGGKMIFYRALITMDVGFFAISIHGTGQRYVLFYFTIYYLFAGIISIFRSLESRRLEAGTWKVKFGNGIFDLAIAVICLIHNNSESVMLDVLCFALIVSAITRIMVVLKKSAIIYIP
ncbi:DUF308 domain-containing protein [Brotaphodocola sp.]|uniref:DUF308 domain-containing protein n=1 Tax=Brotaphodocola sp. TaxID=3073577 RepID=UPI003D7DA635